MRRQIRTTVGATLAAVVLAACGSTTSDNGNDETTAGSGEESTKDVTDLRGTVTVPANPQRIIATDNRLFRSLEEWGVELVAAPVPLVPRDVAYKTADLVDLGSHVEPNLEGFVEAQPDLILNGQRFADHYDAIADLVGDVAIVDTDIDAEKPLDEELRRQITLAGDALGHEEEAAALIERFDTAIEAAAAAYDPEETVMGLLTSGGDISYSAPVTGRAVGPLYPILNLTPALEQEANDASHGDDISVEAIAAANPDWLIVMDRDAAIQPEGEEFTSAQEIIEESEALQSVTAVREGQVIYLPANFYVTEDIQAYTELLEEMAQRFGER